MKKLLLLSLMMLSSCTLVDAYLMTHYDPNEYATITGIRALAQMAKEQCDDPVASRANAIKLEQDTQFFVLFSEHVPRNDDVVSASKDLHVIAQGLSDQYIKTGKVSVGFCKIKFASIESNADKMQTVIGKRPR